MTSPDVIVVGAGIVGAACAVALQARGRNVLLLDRSHPGAGTTAAGMGHLVALDESDDELDLCLLSLRHWDRYLAEHGKDVDHARCGTLWVAEDEEQLANAASRAERLARRGWQAELLSGALLAEAEPALRPGLAGGVRVLADSVVYPPAVARDLAKRLTALGGATLFDAAVGAIGTGFVQLHSGRRIEAHDVVVASGCAVPALLPAMPVFPRKGHLAITDRYPGRLRHQVVSMGYGQTAAGADGLAVAANVQPRPTGQWLVGSCRQDGIADTHVDPRVLGALLRSAIALLPCLAQMRIVRSWTGMRPATPDGRPLIGRHPGLPRTWLAAGHEGLGVTTAFGTAEILADLVCGHRPPIDPIPYSPARFCHD
ncbi:NAD(P)/FAD-dependent oxidoreductase [Pseudoduganella chitinolytica]|uniref:FAD-dependent oxidoreductase n=1 Tax=Pseudoduganella chitinolytica TaxID=34070 RepID=A0ABY8B500_9BURK|nr:FAD-dependent oxidoreductase [Pseudoduganella chitinolytica]WEF30821.1 FAD-dependent oxidoreductase [Pseudoduganella chitinolytica]